MNELNETVNILLVEDNIDDVRLIELLLDRAKQFKNSLCVADQLSTALEICSTASCDVVLLDLGLPDSQGLDTLAAMLAKLPHVPIIVFTVSDDTELGVMAVQRGAQDYLAKGHVGSYELVRAIRYAIERKRIKVALEKSNYELQNEVEERKVAEEELRITAEELRRSNKELEQFATSPRTTCRSHSGR